MTSREKFKVGDRVEKSKENPEVSRKPYTRFGVVKAIDGMGVYVKVLQDGCGRCQWWHVDFWKKAKEAHDGE